MTLQDSQEFFKLLLSTLEKHMREFTDQVTPPPPPSEKMPAYLLARSIVCTSQSTLWVSLASAGLPKPYQRGTPSPHHAAQPCHCRQWQGCLVPAGHCSLTACWEGMLHASHNAEVQVQALALLLSSQSRRQPMGWHQSVGSKASTKA